jgi:fructokinase
MGTGLVALDLVVSNDNSVPPRYYAGGTCGNVLTILSFLGWTAYPVARLYPGAAAEQLRRDLARWAVRLDFVTRRRAGSTPIIVQRVGMDREGNPVHRFAWSCPGCGSILPGYRPIRADDAERIARDLPQARVFFMDRVSAGALLLAQRASENGALVVFEPSGIGDPKLFGRAVQIAHVLKYSRDRLAHLDLQGHADRPLVEIETLGEEGLRYRASTPGSRSGWTSLPAFPLRRFRDAAGSGDWCSAGFLSRIAAEGRRGLLQRTSAEIEEALRFGQALAAWNCGFQGARGGMYYQSAEEMRTAVARIAGGEVMDNRDLHEAVAAKLRCVCPACRRMGRIMQAVQKLHTHRHR